MPPLPRAQVFAAIALIGVLLLAGAGSLLRRRLPAPAPPLPAVSSPTSTPVGGNAPADVPSTTVPVSPVPERPPVVIHVAGCVRQPGLYAFPEGARVYDALKRAGGAKEGADLEAINLAAHLKDGVQVYVPRKSAAEAKAAPGPRPSRPRREASPWLPPEGIRIEPLPPVPEGRMPLEPHTPASPTAPGKTTTEPPAKIRTPADGKVNINTAGLEELQRLPHVGPATARKILDYRKENGPFRSVEQLLEIRGIGDKYLAEMRDLVEL